MQTPDGLPAEETTPQAQPKLKALVKPQREEDYPFVEAYCQEAYACNQPSQPQCTSGYSTFWSTGVCDEDDILL